MDIRVLRYFLVLAREENISAAAEALHTTQPNLSRQLSELEKELNKKLFIRGSRRITLTKEGLFLRRRAQEIVNLIDKTQMDFNTDGEITDGDLSICTAATNSMHIIAKAIKQLQNNYPQIQYHITTENSYDTAKKLDDGLIDFGILPEPVDLTKYEYIRLPEPDAWGVLMRCDSPLADAGFITPDDLIDMPLICAQQLLDGNALSNWFGSKFGQLNITAVYNLTSPPAIMAENGIGYILTPDNPINTADSRLCFKPLSPHLETGIYIVWKKYQILTPPAKKFLEKFRETLV